MFSAGLQMEGAALSNWYGARADSLGIGEGALIVGRAVTEVAGGEGKLTSTLRLPVSLTVSQGFAQCSSESPWGLSQVLGGRDYSTWAVLVGVDMLSWDMAGQEN